MDDVLCEFCRAGVVAVVCQYNDLWYVTCLCLGFDEEGSSANCIGMGYAGTAGMVWGWIISMVFIQSIAMSMAELCSAMPTRYAAIQNHKKEAE